MTHFNRNDVVIYEGQIGVVVDVYLDLVKVHILKTGQFENIPNYKLDKVDESFHELVRDGGLMSQIANQLNTQKAIEELHKLYKTELTPLPDASTTIGIYTVMIIDPAKTSMIVRSDQYGEQVWKRSRPQSKSKASIKCQGCGKLVGEYVFRPNLNKSNRSHRICESCFNRVSDQFV